MLLRPASGAGEMVYIFKQPPTQFGRRFVVHSIRAQRNTRNEAVDIVLCWCVLVVLCCGDMPLVVAVLSFGMHMCAIAVSSKVCIHYVYTMYIYIILREFSEFSNKIFFFNFIIRKAIPEQLPIKFHERVLADDEKHPGSITTINLPF